ncbi:MAG TPA: hypothetical protein PK289_01800 [Bacteroidia bacterium]|jgi:tetratricopeptide (TPR) repeat protein|nr:hypothetical protein [Bacteroidia bacterium]HRG52817.1 hypothetical protein [Bacteroidia bacterium]
MESNPFLLTQEINNYLVGLNNLMNIQQTIGLFEEVMDTVKKLKSINVSSETEKIRVVEYVLPKEISYHVAKGTFDEGMELLPRIEKQLAVYENQMGKPFQLSIYTNIVELCIMAESFRKALQWNNRILNSEEIETYSDFYTNARLSEIIIHYELENIEKVDSLLKSFQLLLSKKPAYKFEIALLRFLKGFIHVEESKKMIKFLKSFQEELNEIGKDPIEKVAFYFFDMQIWLDSKIKKMGSRK